MADPTEEEMRSDLVKQINDEADISFQEGRKNNIWDLGFSIGAITASVCATGFATVFASVHAVDPAGVHTWMGYVTAVLAGLPTLCNGLQRAIDCRGRSGWYFVKYGKLTDLALRLEHDPELLPKDGAIKLGAIRKEMEERWAELVKTGKPPKRGKA